MRVFRATIIVLGDNGQVLLATEAPNFGYLPTLLRLRICGNLDATTGAMDIHPYRFGADLIFWRVRQR